MPCVSVGILFLMHSFTARSTAHQRGIARDILCYAMQTLKNCAIVAHVHDEIIIEADRRMSSSEQYELMSLTAFLAAGILQGKNASTFQNGSPPQKDGGEYQIDFRREKR